MMKMRNLMMKMEKEAEEAAERARADMAADVDFSVVAAQIAEAGAQQRTVEELRKLKQRI